MLSALHQRADRDDEGFTLIELMVVVLIIGILLAIAIPTFLGARNRANDVSAQSNLRNALTAEKVLFTDNQAYTASGAVGTNTALVGVEPALTWAPAVNAKNNRYVVATVFNNGTTVVLEDESATGNCFAIGDVFGTTPGVTEGTYYMEDTTCSTSNITAPSSTQAAANPNTSSAPNAQWAAAF